MGIINGIGIAIETTTQDGVPSGGPPFEYTAIANNYSMTFDGTNYINTGPSTLSGETALTISAWVKPTSYGGAAAESFISTDKASPRGFYLGLYNAQNFRFAFTTNGVNLTAINTATSTVDLNVWQHILVTWDQVNLKLYKNGVLLNTVPTTFASNGTFTTTNDLLIGVRQSPNVGAFPGNIDECAYWNTILSEDTIEKIYNTTNDNPGKVADLSETPEGAPLAWYRFE